MTIVPFRRRLWCALALSLVPQAARALPDHTTYDVVLGQVRLDVRRPNSPAAASLATPQAVAADTAHGHLYVLDADNGRILAYKSAKTVATGAAADLILGQPDPYASDRFHAGATTLGRPTAAVVDSSGTLWVADTLHSRVLGFKWPFDPQASPADHAAADFVVGQPDFHTGYPGAACNGGDPTGSAPPSPSSAQALCGPTGLAVDTLGNLYVADTGNHRVLLFPTPVPTTGASATAVFGQAQLAGTQPHQAGCNRGAAGPSGGSLCNPAGLLLGTMGLYIADTSNNRVVFYRDPLHKQDSADGALLQSSLTDGSATPGPDHLLQPVALVQDLQGVLWISEAGNHRVTGFKPADISSPDAGGGTTGTASYLLGQVDGFAGTPNGGLAGQITPLPSATTLYSPAGLALDADGRLLLADSGNHRVLIYKDATDPSGAADLALGQKDLGHGSRNRTGPTGMLFPTAVAVDVPDPAQRAGEATHAYVADHGNSRVLAWRDISRLKSGQAPDLVIGQKTAADSACNMGGVPSKTTLCWPRGVFVDRNGDLWVADTWNNRVLRFPRPLSQKGLPAADLVLGQSSFNWRDVNGVGMAGAPSARTLWSPVAVAVDASGTVWVADRDNNRVVGYAGTPLQSGMPATRLLLGNGLTGFTQGGCQAGGDASQLCAPSSLAVDPAGNLWVADRNHHRVAAYSTVPLDPLTGLLAATPVGIVGQLTGQDVQPNNGEAKAGPQGLSFPEGVALEIVTGGDKSTLTAIVVADTGNNRVLTFSPPGWQSIPSGVQNDMNGVWGSGPRDAWAVGNSGTIVHWNGDAWQSVNGGGQTASNLRAVWGSGPGDVWAVGTGGVIVHYGATGWQVMQSGTQQYELRAVWGSGPTSAWAVGTGGTILHWDGTAWSQQSSGTIKDLNGVWGSGPSDVWAVGQGGTVLRSGGAQWTPGPALAGLTADLNGVWGSGAGDVWIVGKVGTVLRYNGTVLSALDGNRQGNMSGVWGAGASYVRLVDEVGNIYSWDGAALSMTKAFVNLAAVWGSRAGDVFAVGPGGAIVQYRTFLPTAVGTMGQMDTVSGQEDRDAVYRDTPANVAQGLSAPRGVAVTAAGLFIADSGLSGPVGKATGVQPDFSADSGNHRVIFIETVGQETADMAGPGGHADMGTTPPPKGGGCSCQIGGARQSSAQTGAPVGAGAGLLLLCAAALPLRRRQRTQRTE